MLLPLLSHQLAPYEWAKPRTRIALFLEMRVGKTFVTMHWAAHRQLKRVLLLGPWNTLVGTRNWEGHLRRAGIPVTTLCLMKTEDRAAASQWTWTRAIVPALVDDGLARPGDTTRGLVRRPARGWFLLHFEGLRVAPEVLEQEWDAILVDESTRIRNPSAQITKLLLRKGHAEHRVILSGLPNPESPMDYFTQFQFLLGHCMGYDNFWAWKQRYFVQGDQGWDWYPKKGTIDALKQFVHQNSFILTRKAAGIGSDKVFEQRSVAMNPAQVRALREVKKKWAHDDVETKYAPVVHTWMQRIAGGFAPGDNNTPISDGKIRLLHEVATLEYPTAGIVVWFRFNAEIDAAYAYLEKKKVSVERVHGGLDIPKIERTVIQDRFQDGETRVLLMQVALGQFGWDLSRADVVIYYSNTYEFEDRRQSEDRAIHPTKTTPVTYIDLVTIGSTDEDVVDSLTDKDVDAKRFTRAMASRIAQRLAKVQRVNPGDDV